MFNSVNTTGGEEDEVSVNDKKHGNIRVRIKIINIGGRFKKKRYCHFYKKKKKNVGPALLVLTKQFLTSTTLK